MADLVLFLIRHAEKPGEAWPGHGFTEQGEEDSKSLVLRGWQRAGAWAALFAAGSGPDYPRPDYLYAAKPGEGDDPDHGPSRRPAETLQPLADRMVGVGLKTEYAQGQEAELAAELLTLSGIVLVSWEHKAIVEALVPRLPVADGSPPTQWPGDRFDVVLRFDRPAGAEAFTYRMLFPRLLSGDSDQGFDA
jgi:hypothetical protein